MKRRILLYVVFLILLVFVVTPVAFVGVDLALWYPYYGRLKDINKPPADDVWEPELLPAETVRKLGSVYNTQESWFGNFPKEKRPGVIRIGAFGDSFTHGDEVDRTGDFPAQLGTLLKSAGAADVEVLNFGNSWYGFGQAYMMWEDVGREYNLDYVLLGPMSFFADRDTRFNHTGGLNPYYLHSRFILDGAGVRRVDVQGATHSERFAKYHGFVPTWDYLRYDRNDPPFLAALLPAGRTLDNPFYYRSEPERAEATEIYRRLLKTMSESGIPTVLGIYFWFNDVWQVASSLGSDKFCVTSLDRPMQFPYLAPGGHNSPAGNLFLAHQYLSALLNRPIDAPLMVTFDLDAADAAAVDLQDLSSYDTVKIVDGDAEAGQFAAYGNTSHQASPEFLKSGGFNAILAMKPPGHSMLDGLWVALPAMDKTAPITLKFRSAEGELSTPAGGSVRVGPIVSVDLPGLSLAEPDVVDPRDLSAVFHRKLPAGTLQVLVGDNVVMEGSNSEDWQNIRLRAASGGQTYVVRGSATSIPDASEIGRSGTIDLVATRGSDVTRVPLVRWVVEATPVSPSLMCPKFRAPIAANSNLVNFRTTPDSVDVSIMASSDEYEGPPQMRVRLDGQFVGDFLVDAKHMADEWQEFALRVPSNGEPSRLTIEFLNDNWNPETLQDRNLWIQQVTVGSKVFKPEEAAFLDAASKEEKEGTSLIGVKGELIFDLQQGAEH